MRDQLDVEAELIVGQSGIFEVAVDGNVVSAKARGVFPTEQEIADAVARAIPA